MNSLEYNGALLKNVLTHSFDQRVVRDPSETDAWYWEIALHVSTTIYDTTYAPSDHQHGVAIIGVDTGGVSDVGTREIAIRERLQKDRGILKYILNDTLTVYSDEQVDQDNGPKVSSLRISRLSPRLLHLDFEIKAAIGCQQSNFNIVGNRWQVIDDIDTNYRTTRTWNGRIRMGGRSPQSGKISPHQFRGLIVPPLAKGFKRGKMQFFGEPNGLELAYTVVDEEISGGAPPFPATKMSGMHTESVFIDATQSIGEFRLRLEAPKNVAKGDLISAAVAIGNQKMMIAPGSETLHQLLQLSISDIIADDVNAIEVHMRVRHKGIATEQLGGAVIKYIGHPIVLNDYDPDQATMINTPFATAALAKSFACYLQSPCDSHNHPITTGGSGVGEALLITEDIGGERITYSNVQQLPEFVIPTYAVSHDEAAYQHYTIDVVFDRNEYRVGLPIALSGTAPRTDEPSVKMVALARPGCKMNVRIAGERIGDWPELPKNKDFVDAINNIQHWVLKYKQNRRAPALMPDGVNYLHVVDADIFYLLERAPRDEEFSSANLPWDGQAPLQSRTSDDAFLEPVEYFL